MEYVEAVRNVVLAKQAYLEAKDRWEQSLKVLREARVANGLSGVFVHKGPPPVKLPERGLKVSYRVPDPSAPKEDRPIRTGLLLDYFQVENNVLVRVAPDPITTSWPVGVFGSNEQKQQVKDETDPIWISYSSLIIPGKSEV